MKASELIVELQKQIETFGDYPVEFDCDPKVPPQYMSRPVEMVGACNGVKYGEKLQSICLMHRRAFRDQCLRGTAQEDEISKLLFELREPPRNRSNPAERYYWLGFAILALACAAWLIFPSK